MNEKIKKNKYIWIAFLVALLPRLLFLVKTYPLSITGDEMFAMFPAAKLLGYDWSGVMRDYRYYGYGYTVLLIPFMALIKNPVVLYRSMVGLMALCQALIAPISFHLMKRYLKVEGERLTCLIAITCSYLVAVRATYTYPEFVYVLVVWLMIWVLLELITEDIQRQWKNKCVYTILLFMMMAYAYTVHSRAVALWGALFITIILYAWSYKQMFLSIPVCVIVGIPAFFAVRMGIGKILAFLNVGQNGTIANTTAGVPISVLEIFKNPKSWTAWADIIIGQLNESVVLTGGIAVPIVVVIWMLIWRALRRDLNIGIDEKVKYLPYIVVGIFCICTIGITIGGQSVTWLGGVLMLFEQNASGDAFRAITYLRYYGAYIGPLFMLGSVYITQNTEIIEKIKGKILLITTVLQGYWVLVILPILCYELGCVWSYAPFSFTRGFMADSVGIRSYFPATLFVFIFTIFSYQMFERKKMKSIVGLLCFVLMYTYMFNGLYHERYRGEKNYQYCQSTVEWIYKLENAGVAVDEVYMEQEAIPETGMDEALEYQFLMPEKRIVLGMPDKNEGIYIYHNQEAVPKKLNGNSIKIDENTYVYVWGENFQKKIQKIEHNN